MRNKRVIFRFCLPAITLVTAGILMLGLILSFVICHLSFPARAMGGPVPRGQAAGFLIDNFENGNFTTKPAWWVFDHISPEVLSKNNFPDGDHLVAREMGNYSLFIKGTTKTAWYAGGMGVYLSRPGQELSQYRNLQIDLYGYGPGQGTLKIELFDDDNNNWETEQNTREGYALLYDDRFVAEVMVDWLGWKRVVIPFSDFKDDNPGVGDDLWNPFQTGNSGGLLQMQFICIASSKNGALQYAVDNLRLTK
jgi:hypothetical protein